MRFRIDQTLQAAVDAVDAALVDPAFLVRMDELPKLGAAEVLDQRREGDVVRQDVRYLFQAELSAAVTRVVDPALMTWVERSECNLVTHATSCEIRPDHYGSMLSGRYDAVTVTVDAGSRRTITGEVKVRIPLVGGKVERAIVSGLEENATAQATLLDTFIA